MKYIDADKLKEQILDEIHQLDYTEASGGYMMNAFSVCISFIDSLDDLWHTKTERPKYDDLETRILVLFEDNHAAIYKSYDFLNLRRVSKWAYIKDLLPID